MFTKRNVFKKKFTVSWPEKPHILLFVLLLFLVGCTNANADGGSGKLNTGGVHLPPAWTPTPISIPDTGADEGTWQPCGDASPSRLEVGDLAVVEGTSFKLRLRKEPGIEGTPGGEILPGDIIEVINGPSCFDKLVWWEVQSLSSGSSGWTAEGNAYGDWLVKVD